jgi:hypothetical protein
MAFGLFLFWFMAMYDYSTEGGLSFMWNPAIRSVLFFFFNTIPQVSGTTAVVPEMGDYAFSGFCLAVISFIALRRRKGIKVAIMEGISLFAAPLLVMFELGIWFFYFSRPDNDLVFRGGVMTWFVASFARWSLDGAYILSNYNVLIVALSIFTVGVIWWCWRLAPLSLQRRYLSGIAVMFCIIILFGLLVSISPLALSSLNRPVSNSSTPSRNNGSIGNVIGGVGMQEGGKSSSVVIHVPIGGHGT